MVGIFRKGRETKANETLRRRAALCIVTAQSNQGQTGGKMGVAREGSHSLLATEFGR